MEKITTDSVLKRVRRIIAETTGTEDAAVTARIADLCADSLEAASIIVDVEDEFSIDIESIYGPGTGTVGDLVKSIEAKL